jgi:colicin import membrane protein
MKTTLDLEASQLTEVPDEFSRGVIVSLTLHLGIILFFVIKGFLFREEVIDYSQAIRVDIVGLPEKVKQEKIKKISPQEAVQESPQVNLEVAPKEEVMEPTEKSLRPTVTPLPVKIDKDFLNLAQLKKNQAKQKEAFQKLKTMTAIERIQKEVERDKKESNDSKKASTVGVPAKNVPIKGNILAPGSELVGIDKLQHESYASELDRHVKQFWSLPEWLNRKGYKAQLVVHIDERGQIISRELLNPSGNPQFDESIIATIDQSNPLPPPPEKLSAKVRSEGILIGFGDWEK